jgi:hypothetical protein
MQMKLPNVTNPDWHFSEIRNLYWMLRYLRGEQDAKRRSLYRKIEKHKKALCETGLEVEELRLYCRWLMSPRDESRKHRLLTYQSDKKALGFPVYINVE